MAGVRPDHGPLAGGDDAGVRAQRPGTGCRATRATAGTAAAVDGEAAGRARGVHAGVQDRRARLDALRGLEAPVYFALGGLSNPDQYARIAERLAGVFADFTLEVFEQCHHFHPPHRLESERLALSLRGLWARGETVSMSG